MSASNKTVNNLALRKQRIKTTFLDESTNVTVCVDVNV